MNVSKYGIYVDVFLKHEMHEHWRKGNDTRIKFIKVILRTFHHRLDRNPESLTPYSQAGLTNPSLIHHF